MIRARIEEILEEILPEKIEADTSLFEGGILGSVELLMLIDSLEKAFDITIEGDEIDYSNLDSIDQIMEFLDRKGVKETSE